MFLYSLTDEAEGDQVRIYYIHYRAYSYRRLDSCTKHSYDDSFSYLINIQHRSVCAISPQHGGEMAQFSKKTKSSAKLYRNYRFFHHFTHFELKHYIQDSNESKFQANQIQNFHSMRKNLLSVPSHPTLPFMFNWYMHVAVVQYTRMYRLLITTNILSL